MSETEVFYFLSPSSIFIPGLDPSGLWVWIYYAISLLIRVKGVFYVPWFTLVPNDWQKTDIVVTCRHVYLTGTGGGGGGAPF